MDLNVAAKNTTGNQKKKCYNCDKKGHFVKDCRQLKKLLWKLVPQKSANVADIECSIAIIKKMLSLIDFGNAFTSVSLNVSNIEPEENSDIDKSEEFNIDIQIYLAFKKKYKEFIIMDINLNITRNDNEEHLYKEDDPYLELNNVEYHNIIQMNYIYNYCTFYLKPKATNNFFLKAMFKLIKRIYTFEETEYWILIIRTTMYRIFTSSSEHPPIYIKKGATLKGC